MVSRFGSHSKIYFMSDSMKHTLTMFHQRGDDLSNWNLGVPVFKVFFILH